MINVDLIQSESPNVSTKNPSHQYTTISNIIIIMTCDNYYSNYESQFDFLEARSGYNTNNTFCKFYYNKGSELDGHMCE